MINTLLVCITLGILLIEILLITKITIQIKQLRDSGKRLKELLNNSKSTLKMKHTKHVKLIF